MNMVDHTTLAIQRQLKKNLFDLQSINKNARIMAKPWMFRLRFNFHWATWNKVTDENFKKVAF